MAVRSPQLAATSFGDGSQHSLYTVPTGYRTIVKSIVVKSAQGAAVVVTFAVKHGLSSLSAFSVGLAASGAANDTAYLSPWVVLMEGDSLLVTFGSSGGWVTVSGAELLL